MSLFKNAVRPAWAKRLDPTKLPKAVADAARVYGAINGVSWEHMLYALLTFSGALMHGARVYPKGYPQLAENFHLFCLIVAPSGSCKTVLSKFLALLAAKLDDRQRFSERFVQLRETINNQLKAEGLTERMIELVDELSTVITDMTIEGLQHRQNQFSERLILLLDEFMVLADMLCRGGGDGKLELGYLLKAFNNAPHCKVLVDKVRRVVRTGLSILAWTQPAVVQDFLSSEKGIVGLLARWLVIAPHCEASKLDDIPKLFDPSLLPSFDDPWPEPKDITYHKFIDGSVLMTACDQMQFTHSAKQGQGMPGESRAEWIIEDPVHFQGHFDGGADKINTGWGMGDERIAAKVSKTRSLSLRVSGLLATLDLHLCYAAKRITTAEYTERLFVVEPVHVEGAMMILEHAEVFPQLVEAMTAADATAAEAAAPARGRSKLVRIDPPSSVEEREAWLGTVKEELEYQLVRWFVSKGAEVIPGAMVTKGNQKVRERLLEATGNQDYTVHFLCKEKFSLTEAGEYQKEGQLLVYSTHGKPMMGGTQQGWLLTARFSSDPDVQAMQAKELAAAGVTLEAFKGLRGKQLVAPPGRAGRSAAGTSAATSVVPGSAPAASAAATPALRKIAANEEVVSPGLEAILKTGSRAQQQHQQQEKQIADDDEDFDLSLIHTAGGGGHGAVPSAAAEEPAAATPAETEAPAEPAAAPADADSKSPEKKKRKKDKVSAAQAAAAEPSTSQAAAAEGADGPRRASGRATKPSQRKLLSQQGK